ncbi:hypothetical protein ACFL4R_00180 [Nitrospirota bacterium]
MSFYIYSPNKKLGIPYFFESFELIKDGSSNHVVDLLIDNQSNEPASELYLLYPNRFFKVDVNEGVGKILGTFEDLTHTFLDHDSPLNVLYRTPGIHLDYNPEYDMSPYESIFSVPLRITQPSPENILDNISIQGLIASDSQIAIDENMNIIEARIFEKIGFTVFKIKLKMELKANSPQWFRFGFLEKNFAYNMLDTNLFQRVLIKIGKKYTYKYLILSPAGVLNKFLNSIQAFKKVSLTNEGSSAFSESLSNVISRFESDGLFNGNTQTVFRRNQVHVFPGKLKNLTDINLDGNVKIKGLLPNTILLPSGNKIMFYSWDATLAIDSGKELLYSIFFSATS